MQSEIYIKKWKGFDFTSENDIEELNIILSKSKAECSSYFLIIGVNENLTSKVFYAAEEYEFIRARCISYLSKSKYFFEKNKGKESIIFSSYLNIDQLNKGSAKALVQYFSFVSIIFFQKNTTWEKVKRELNKFSFFDILSTSRWNKLFTTMFFIDVEHGGLMFSSKNKKIIDSTISSFEVI